MGQTREFLWCLPALRQLRGFLRHQFHSECLEAKLSVTLENECDSERKGPLKLQKSKKSFSLFPFPSVVIAVHVSHELSPREDKEPRFPAQ